MRGRSMLTAGMLGAVLLLSACAERVWAPEHEVRRAMHNTDAPASLTLVTVESTRNGSGAHSALLVNGPHRVLFDPAGTFKHPRVPERNDVLYGVTDNVWNVYIDYHARETFNVRTQEVRVSPEVAARAMALVQDHGAVPKANCNVAVTRILSQLPGFETVPRGWYPKRTMQWMQSYPGVSERLITDDDADDNHGVLFRAAQAVEIQDDDR